METPTTDTSVNHQPQRVTPEDPRRWRALAVLAVAQFMLILDITVVNIALPSIGADLGLSRAEVAWVITAYTLFFGGLMLLGGRSADLFGSRRVAMTGLGVFTAASLLAGVAANAPMLLAGRIGQGIGAALLSPAALSIITTTFHGTERNKALGVWGALGGSGAAAGVLLGGLLTAGPGWPWIFFINVPVGVVLLAAMTRMVPATSPGGSTRVIDVPGAVLVTAATAAMIFGLINAGDDGWTSPLTVGSLLAAAVTYAVFGLYARAVRQPLVDPRILTRRPVAAGALLMLIGTGLLIISFFLGSFYLQHVQGYSPLTTGLLFLPVAIATIIGAHRAGEVIGRFGYRPVAILSFTIAAAGAAVPAVWQGTAALVAGISVAAAGLGATFVVATTTALATVEHSRAGITSGIVNTFHELGAALGVAVISTIAAASIATAGADPVGFSDGFTFSAVTAGVAAVAAAVLVPAGKPPAGVRVGGH